MPPRGVKKGTKRARQYEHIKQSERNRGAPETGQKEIAARTVNKEGPARARRRSASPPRSSRSWSGLALPPLAISATRLPASSSRSCSAAASGEAPAASIRLRVDLDHRRAARADLVVADEDEVVEQLPHDPLRQLERDARREALGERPHLVLEQCALAPRAVRRRRRIRLHSDHADRRIERLARRSHAPAAPLPPPIGTMIVSMRGSSSSSSSVAVATPAIRCGSLPEWT